MPDSEVRHPSPPSVSLELLSIRGTAVQLGTTYQEIVVVILGGHCSLRFFPSGPQFAHLGSRSDVFDGPASAIYIPVGRSCEIVASSAGVHLAIVKAQATHSYDPYVVHPTELTAQRRGRATWVRDVFDIVGPERPAQRLLVGETFSAEGVW